MAGESQGLLAATRSSDAPDHQILQVMRPFGIGPRLSISVRGRLHTGAKLASVEQKGGKDAPLTVEIIELRVDPVTKRADTTALPSPRMASVAGWD
jgi:hypothetical protein